MEELVFAGVVVILILLLDTRKTIVSLKARIAELEFRGVPERAEIERDYSPDPAPVVPTQQAETKPVPEPAKRAQPTAKLAAKSASETEHVKEPAEKPIITPAPPKISAAKRFEDLIGGKLPIWIGGIALVFAGFFLVRFSIEAGLFGPAARCITAALFGLIMIGLAEFGKRIPKFGSIFTDDLRIGHSIAGAGIAVLYATLYMASELYGLLGLTSALIGVIGVTILAFFLSQKHGPPTAIMGLLGGFAAPYVAGLGPESVAPLLIYLGVFTAGIFGLAIHRGWAWLALLATGGSVIWTTALLFMDISGDIPFVGAFITLLAIGGVLTISRTGSSFGIPKPLVQAIPLGVGLLQLIALAPLIEFSLMSWLFFGVLAVFTIALAWRDETMTPAVGGALGLSLVMVTLAYFSGQDNQIALWAAGAFALLFTISGHGFAMREKSGWMWALIAMAAPTGMLIITAMFNADWSNTKIGALCMIVAASHALMTWRTHASVSRFVMPLASGLTAVFVASALWLWTPFEMAALVAVTVAAGLAAWARFASSKAVMLQTVMAVCGTGLFMLVSGFGIVEAFGESLAGTTNLYQFLPRVSEMLLELLAPAAAIIAITFLFRETFGKPVSRLIAAIGGIAGGSFAYLLLKQPLAIGPIQDFVAYGFAERAVFTHVLALSGWLLLWRQWPEKLSAPLKALGAALAAVALFRFIYFDIFLLSPTAVKQAIGPAPLANLGTLHYTAAALWLWLYARTKTVAEILPPLSRVLNIASLFAAIAAVMVTVRQAVHGTDIATPPFTSTETYLYSAALLVLAIAWMARGIQKTNALLRIAGLLLLTVVTFKVFVLDARQLEGVLRILSFLGLGIALIGIGWIYGKVMKTGEPANEDGESKEEIPA